MVFVRSFPPALCDARDLHCRGDNCCCRHIRPPVVYSGIENILSLYGLDQVRRVGINRRKITKNPVGQRLIGFLLSIYNT